jgi:hypothetical protein
LFTCEFSGSVTKIDLVERKVLGTIKLSQYFNRPDALALIALPGKKPRKIPDPGQPGNEICTTPGMPQDVRASPDGKTFFVADMMADGVHVVDGESFRQIGFIATGVGAHGLYPSRDGKSLYVANRGGNQIRGKPAGQRQRVGDRFRHPQRDPDLADPGWRQPGHGQCQRRRTIPVVVGPIRRRGLPHRYHGPARSTRSRSGASRTA